MAAVSFSAKNRISTSFWMMPATTDDQSAKSLKYRQTSQVLSPNHYQATVDFTQRFWRNTVDVSRDCKPVSLDLNEPDNSPSCSECTPAGAMAPPVQGCQVQISIKSQNSAKKKPEKANLATLTPWQKSDCLQQDLSQAHLRFFVWL